MDEQGGDAPLFLPSCLLSVERLEARRTGLFMKIAFDTIWILQFDFWFFTWDDSLPPLTLTPQLLSLLFLPDCSDDWLLLTSRETTSAFLLCPLQRGPCLSQHSGGHPGHAVHGQPAVLIVLSSYLQPADLVDRGAGPKQYELQQWAGHSVLQSCFPAHPRKAAHQAASILENRE